MCRQEEKYEIIYWTNNIYRQLLLNSCFSSRRQYFLPRQIIICGSQYNFSASAILLFHFSEMVPLLAQLFLGILGDFQENRVKHALCIENQNPALRAFMTVSRLESTFISFSIIICHIINLI